MFASCLFFLLLCVSFSSIQRILPLCLLYPPYPVAVSPLFPGSCHCVSFISLSRPRVSSIPCILSLLSLYPPYPVPYVSSIPLILSLYLLYPPYPVPVSPLPPYSVPMPLLSPVFCPCDSSIPPYPLSMSPLSLSPPWFAGVDRNATYCATHTHTLGPKPRQQGLRPAGKVVCFQPLRQAQATPFS